MMRKAKKEEERVRVREMGGRSRRGGKGCEARSHLRSEVSFDTDY